MRKSGPHWPGVKSSVCDRHSGSLLRSQIRNTLIPVSEAKQRRPGPLVCSDVREGQPCIRGQFEKPRLMSHREGALQYIHRLGVCSTGGRECCTELLGRSHPQHSQFDRQRGRHRLEVLDHLRMWRRVWIP